VAPAARRATRSLRHATLVRHAKDPFGLVLLDLRMPDIHGHEVVEQIKDHDPQAKVIILTGHALQSVMHAQNLGGDELLDPGVPRPSASQAA
jgi:DNA-binding NtrC family response regulator